jgi:epoxyqueuosine reductase
MGYMARNVDKRLNPSQLVPETLSVICVRLDYLVAERRDLLELLDHPSLAYVSRYALGRDYHKLMRKRLQKFADRIGEVYGEMGYRVFTDSAPVLEKALLGEIYTDMNLQTDAPLENHCGRCTSCIDVCPTGAIVEPYVVDARRCISYLTIEHRSEIPLEFRTAIGMVATIASWYARGTASLNTARSPISNLVTGSTASRYWNVTAGLKPNSSAGWKARRSGA